MGFILFTVLGSSITSLSSMHAAVPAFSTSFIGIFFLKNILFSIISIAIIVMFIMSLPKTIGIVRLCTMWHFNGISCFPILILIIVAPFISFVTPPIPSTNFKVVLTFLLSARLASYLSSISVTKLPVSINTFVLLSPSKASNVIDTLSYRTDQLVV